MVVPQLATINELPDASLASRIAARRQDSARRRMAAAGAPSAAAAAPSAAPPKVSWAPFKELVDIHQQIRPLAGAQAFNRNAGRVQAHARPPSKRSQQSIFPTAKKQPAVDPVAAVCAAFSAEAPPKQNGAKELKPAQLYAIAEKQREKAAWVERSAADDSPGFTRASDVVAHRVGKILHSRKVDVKALTAEWDKAGDGALHVKQFRSHLKKLGGPIGDVSGIDGLFHELDASRTGLLPVRDLRSALKEMQQRAADAAARVDALRAVAARHRTRAEQARMAAEAAETAEVAEAKLGRMREPPEVDGRLGLLLLKRGTKLGEALDRLDKGDGAVAKRDVLASVRTFFPGLETSEHDAELLLARLGAQPDTTSVELAALKRTLRTLHDAAASADADALAMAKTCAPSAHTGHALPLHGEHSSLRRSSDAVWCRCALLRKACRMQQSALHKALHEDALADEVAPHADEDEVAAAPAAEVAGAPSAAPSALEPPPASPRKRWSTAPRRPLVY
jgi:hypothetical protein